MAATGYTPIYLYYSGTATNVPLAANLGAGELAINAADGNLFYKNTSNAVVTIPVLQSSATQSGWLSSTDWSTFNSKAPAGAYLTSVTSDAPLTGAGTSASHLSMPAATGSVNGYLTSTDWTTFNSKQPAGTYVTSVSGTAPVVSSGGTTPAISMAAATSSVNGYLTSADWSTFNDKSPAAGSSSITTVGTITSGTWNGSTIDIAHGGTNATSFTAKSGNVAGLVFFDGTKLTNDATVTDVGYDTSTNTFTALNSSLTGLSKITGSVLSSATNGFVLEGGWPWQLWRDTESSQSSFVSYIDGGFWYLASIPYADRNAAPYGVATTRFQVRDDGTATVTSGNMALTNGNLVIGTSGKGIDFSATAGTGTSELLADYEEGEWTPTLTSTGATFTYGANYGIYTKIGRQVTATFRFYVSASGTVTNPINIAGLPFTSSSTASMTYGGYVVFANTTITPLIQVPVSETNAYLTVEGTAADATPSSLGMSGVNKWLNGVIVYFV